MPSYIKANYRLCPDQFLHYIIWRQPWDLPNLHTSASLSLLLTNLDFNMDEKLELSPKTPRSPPNPTVEEVSNISPSELTDHARY